MNNCTQQAAFRLSLFHMWRSTALRIDLVNKPGRGYSLVFRPT
jgi:hypothetical protein